MATLILVRHGQSQWNKENRFTGWVDVELAQKGIEEAEEAGRLLSGMRFDKAFTSGLKRAQETLKIILEGSGQNGVEIMKSDALNERMYGELQGMDKNEARNKFGEEQVLIWRRSFDVAPPGGESLKDTADRVIPFYKKEIVPLLKSGKSIIISAHGNSLRALMMFMEELSPDQILKVEVPTGNPKIYELDEDLKVKSTQYLK